jgi:hypothetical protein
MKKTYLLLFLIFSLTLNAQITVRGKLTDRQTNEPVISASIGIKGKPSGTISNEEGVFQLTVSKEDQVMVSCLGYKPIAIPASDLSEETKNIFLEQSEEKLEEVLVTKTPLHELLREVMAVSTARFNKPIHLQTYYREFVRRDNKYSNFADGLVDYHVTGNTKKTKADIIVKQNRSINLAKTEDDEGFSMLTVASGITTAYGFSYLDELFTKDKYEWFDFGLKSKTDSQGGMMYVITLDPKPEIEKGLARVVITYDPKTKLIYEIDLQTAPSHQQYAKQRNLLVVRMSVLHMEYKSKYKLVGNNYVLSYSNRNAKVRFWNKKREYLMESRSDLIVTDFGVEHGYDKKSTFKKRFLYEKPQNFSSKFWQHNNAIVLTDEEQQIITNLEKASADLPAQNIQD